MTDTRQVSTRDLRAAAIYLSAGEATANDASTLMNQAADELDRLRQQPAIAFRWVPHADNDDGSEHGEFAMFVGDAAVAFVTSGEYGFFGAESDPRDGYFTYRYTEDGWAVIAGPLDTLAIAKKATEDWFRSQLSAGDGWQAMDTAPKTGARIVAVYEYPFPGAVALHFDDLREGWFDPVGTEWQLDRLAGWRAFPDALPPKEHG